MPCPAEHSVSGLHHLGVLSRPGGIGGERFGMSAPQGDRDGAGEASRAPARTTAVRHLVLGFALLLTILFTAALCSLPR